MERDAPGRRIHAYIALFRLQGMITVLIFYCNGAHPLLAKLEGREEQDPGAALGAVAVRAPIRATFVDAGAAFEHIFTFGGNPISSAAALAVLEIWEGDALTEHVAVMESDFRTALERLREHRFIGDIRVSGFMASIEFVADRKTREPFPPDAKVGARVREAGLRNGIVTYPGSGMADGVRGDIVSLYPPLTFTAGHIAELVKGLEAAFIEIDRELS